MKQTILIIATLVVSLWACDTQAQTVIELNRQQFLDKVWNYETSPEAWKYQGTLPCVIDFNAKWCGPCRKMEPILENLALKYRDRIIIYKVDVDKEKELERLYKEKEKLEGEIKRVEGKLNNQGFVAKAPQKVIDEEKEKGIKYRDMLGKVLQSIDDMNKLN